MNEPPQSEIDDCRAMNIKEPVTEWESAIWVDVQHEMCGAKFLLSRALKPKYFRMSTCLQNCGFVLPRHYLSVSRQIRHTA